MSENKFGLADLELNDVDAGFEVNPETYKDQANPAPPAYGNYGFKILNIGARTTKEGVAILQNDRYPILSLNQVEITEGLGDGVTRKVGLFQDVPTKPFERIGVAVSALADLIRSIDATRAWRGLDEGRDILREAFDQGIQAHAQFDWSAYDKAFVEAAFEQLQLPKSKDERTDEQNAAVSAIYKTARITGMKFFPFNENSGKFHPEITLGNITFRPGKNAAPVTVEVESRTLEARPTITRYYPSTDAQGGRVKLGPINVKPAVRKLV
jgi:hypothetical protein